MTENFFDTIFPVKHLYSFDVGFQQRKNLHQESIYCLCNPQRTIVKDGNKFIVEYHHHCICSAREDIINYPPIRKVTQKELDRHQTEWIDEEYKSVGIHDTYSRIGSESAIGLRILQGFRMGAGSEN